jgi:transposase InsO family protein
MLNLANTKEFRNLSPKQIVPRLADRGQYIASESSFYRLLREKKQLAHRGKTKVPTPRPKPQFVAQRPNQVWSWDITYLKSPVRGMYYYLYKVMDVYSRRIVGWAVHEEECNELASTLFREALQKAGNPTGLVSHSDNGSVMKGSTLLATLQQLGVITSYSRPSVSNDNPFSESLFHTMKYRPTFPDGRFESLEAARKWVKTFVGWYNTQHRHSGIRFVTPDERHFGQEASILQKRHQLYLRACSAPEAAGVLPRAIGPLDTHRRARAPDASGAVLKTHTALFFK